MNSFPLPVLLSVGCYWLLPGAASSVHGTTSVRVYALNTDGGTTSSLTNQSVQDSESRSDFTDGASGQRSDVSGASWARSEVGWLRLNAEGTASARSPIGSWSGQGKAESVAYWDDTITVNGGAALQGQAGEMTATLVIDGALGLGGGDPYAGGPLANSAGSFFFVQAKMNSVAGKYGANLNFEGGSKLQYVSGGGTAVSAYNGNLIGPGVWQVTFSFVFGQQASFYLSGKVISDARAVVYSAADGLKQVQSTSDFRGGIRWAGINQVRVANGGAVPAYTVTSSSNFDYAAGASASPFGITAFSVSPAGILLSWTDSAMRSYTVEKSTSLAAGSWTPVSGVSWPITGNSILLPPQAEPRAFFRLRAE
jgi:hypothetical protein